MPQSNSNLQSYAKLPAAKNNSPKIPQISLNFSFDGVKSHRGWQMGRGACRSTLSAPSTQISKAHTNYFC